MGKKKRKRQKALESGHNRHHHELEKARQEAQEHMPSDAHIIPDPNRLRHLPQPWCFCRPKVTYTHAVTGKKIYEHRVIIH